MLLEKRILNEELVSTGNDDTVYEITVSTLDGKTLYIDINDRFITGSYSPLETLDESEAPIWCCTTYDQVEEVLDLQLMNYVLKKYAAFCIKYDCKETIKGLPLRYVADHIPLERSINEDYTTVLDEMSKSIATHSGKLLDLLNVGMEYDEYFDLAIQIGNDKYILGYNADLHNSLMELIDEQYDD